LRLSYSTLLIGVSQEDDTRHRIMMPVDVLAWGTVEIPTVELDQVPILVSERVGTL
jgi:hypothetical protein